MTAPLPSSHKPIPFRSKADFVFAKTPPPSRSEILAKLGTPDFYLSDIRVACYRINTVTRHQVLLLFFVIPVYLESSPGYSDLAFIEFDERDQVSRAGMVNTPKDDMQTTARQWFREGHEKAEGKTK
jgi:hypothetical protein